MDSEEASEEPIDQGNKGEGSLLRHYKNTNIFQASNLFEATGNLQKHPYFSTDVSSVLSGKYIVSLRKLLFRMRDLILKYLK